MDLKELLGEELYSQVVEKAGDKRLAVVNDGNWFPKEKFNEKNDEVKDLRDQLKDRDKQLKELSGKAEGNEDLQKQIEKLQEENKQTAKDYQAKLDEQAFDFKLNEALTGAKAKNPKAVKALLDVENIKLDGDKLLGLEDQLKGLQESDAYLFGVEEQKNLRGREPVLNDKQAEPLSKEQFAQMTYGDRVKLYNEKPDLYKKLTN